MVLSRLEPRLYRRRAGGRFGAERTIFAGCWYDHPHAVRFPSPARLPVAGAVAIPGNGRRHRRVRCRRTCVFRADDAGDGLLRSWRPVLAWMRADDHGITREIDEVSCTRLVKRWNRKHAQANVWFMGGIGAVAVYQRKHLDLLRTTGFAGGAGRRRPAPDRRILRLRNGVTAKPTFIFPCNP